MSESVLVLVALAVIPFLLLATTSFAKLSIVLAILRNALGAAQVPGAAITSLLALILSAIVMLPVARDIARACAPYAAAIEWDAPLVGSSRKAVWAALDQGKEPVRSFLARNANRPELGLFLELARRSLPEAERKDVSEKDFSVVLPAFFVSELKEAFQIGFLVLLPFLVLDLVVAILLTALGMQALSPSVVSLPFKLLLFVSVDGFRALVEALVTGYR